jgi:hypothetical protein
MVINGQARAFHIIPREFFEGTCSGHGSERKYRCLAPPELIIESVSFCTSLNVYKTRKVCKLVRELFSFFPPLFVSLRSLCVLRTVTL